MKKVAFVWSSRSEEGLLKPVIRRLKEVPDVKVLEYSNDANCDPNSLGFRYLEFWHTFKLEKPDLVFCSFDRKEMLPVAYAAFLQNIPICQMHAGDVSVGGSWDDSVRHCITLMSTLVFCNGQQSYSKARDLKWLMSSGLDSSIFKTGQELNVYEVGSTALDDIEPDYRDVQEKDSFDLVLYSPPTKQPDRTVPELREIEAMLNKRVVWIGPTSDPGWMTIVEYITDLQKRNSDVHFYVSVDRPKFLALIDHCDRFIGNSSSLFVEAPFFKPKEKLIHIGVRNKGREFIEVRKGGSDRIVEHVRKFLEV